MYNKWAIVRNWLKETGFPYWKTKWKMLQIPKQRKQSYSYHEAWMIRWKQIPGDESLICIRQNGKLNFFFFLIWCYCKKIWKLAYHLKHRVIGRVMNPGNHYLKSQCISIIEILCTFLMPRIENRFGDGVIF